MDGAIYRKDALSIVRDVFKQLQTIFQTVIRSGDNFLQLEAYLNIQFHRFFSLCCVSALSEAVPPLFLLKNADVDNAQRISILS